MEIITETKRVNISSRFRDRNIVILFPMTRSQTSNESRWKRVIQTANSSNVSNLVLIDKTEDFHATRFFKSQVDQIIPDVIVFHRPAHEPTHDSQKLVHLDPDLWIIQLHDDDDWSGALQVRAHWNKVNCIPTDFYLNNAGKLEKVLDRISPDCRTIFSLVSAKLWNRFIELIEEQGGHVAGSIDSSLNLAGYCEQDGIILQDFKYYYDNRHWNSGWKARKQLKKISLEDGWHPNLLVQAALLGRFIDGVVALLFFSEFLSRKEIEKRLESWCKRTKPRKIKIVVYPVMVRVSRQFLKMLPNSDVTFMVSVRKRFEYSIAVRNAIILTWKVRNVPDLIVAVENLLMIDSLTKLRPRFKFWIRTLRLSKENDMDLIFGDVFGNDVK